MLFNCQLELVSVLLTSNLLGSAFGMSTRSSCYFKLCNIPVINKHFYFIWSKAEQKKMHKEEDILCIFLVRHGYLGCYATYTQINCLCGQQSLSWLLQALKWYLCYLIIQRQIYRDANLHTTMVLVVKGKGKKEGGKIEYVVEKDLIPLLRSVILSHILDTKIITYK